ncbi:MAG: fumarylacetoacetate hydrolase family protein [bacterium]
MQRPGKIVCVGRNYAEHAREMGGDVPERPLIFLKPPSAVIASGDPIRLPSASNRVEHEGELGVVVGRRLSGVREQDAMGGVAGLVCVNDVTARDLQRLDSQWTRAKGFDTFCPLGPELRPLTDCPPVEELEVYCRVDGEMRQHGRCRDMIFSIPEVLAYISSIMTLEPGDVVATGTPSGVGPLRAGEVVEVEIPGVGIVRNPVESAVV